MRNKKLDKRYETDETRLFLEIAAMCYFNNVTVVRTIAHSISSELNLYNRIGGDIEERADTSAHTVKNSFIDESREMINSLIHQAAQLDEHYASAKKLFSAIDRCIRLLPIYYPYVDLATQSQINLTLMLLGHAPMGDYDSSLLKRDREALLNLFERCHNLCWYDDVPDEIGRELCHTLNAAKAVVWSGTYLPYFAQLNKLRKMECHAGVRELVGVLNFLYTYYYAK